ncbi:outer membrane efflux family protein [Acinetobacter sp. 479375]|nr:outer membrane efflux family protein [Acinetobacter sp. 479375]
MLEASSNFFQGGAVAAQVKSASYAEEAARSKVNTVYLDVLDQLRTTRENIENKQRQIQVLSERQATTVRIRELYQEQYKLGTRSVLDLLNAEMAIHAANNELETARYDIYNSLVQFIQTTGRTRQAYQLNHLSIQGFEVQP